MSASLTTSEDEVLQGVLEARDPDGNRLTFAIADRPSHGAVVIEISTGAFTYTPDPDFHGNDQFSFTVSDGIARSAPAVVSISVGPIDDAFDIRGLAAPVGGEAGQLLTVAMRISDPEDLAAIELTTASGAPVADFALRPGGFEFRLPAADEARPVTYRLRARDVEGTVVEREFSTTPWPVSPSGLLVTLAGSVRSPGLHWVVAGDGYRASERSLLLQHARETIDLVMTEPLLQAHNAIWNVHVLTVSSAESGADVPSSGIFRDTVFDATFDCGNIGRLLCVDFGKVYEHLLPEIQQFDTVLVLVNSELYGGGAGLLGAAVSVSDLAPQVVLHEMGHAIAGLADEYVDSAIEGGRGGEFQEGLYPNVTGRTHPDEIPWRHWIADPDNLPTNPGDIGIGLFEGAYYSARGLYRPTWNSFMRNTGGPMHAVHAEAWVRRLYQSAPPILGSAPGRAAVTLAPGERRTFGIRRAFSNDVQRVRWYLDGQEIVSGRDVDQMACCTGLTGVHELKVEVTDVTGVIRLPGAPEIRQSRAWNVTIDADRTVPRIDISATPRAVVPGASVTLTWDAANAEFCVASGGWGGVRGTSGSDTVTAPSASTIYRLACTGAAGTTEEVIPILVAPADDAPAVSLAAHAENVAKQEPVRLYWVSTRANACSASGAWSGDLALEGQETLDPISVSSQYTVTCTGPGGSAQASVTVRSRGDLPLLSFTAAPSTVFTGSATLLSWSALNADACEAFGDWSGPRATTGKESVFPGASATYRLDCRGPNGTTTDSVTVTASGAPPPEESPVTLITTEFVEMNGRAGHEGLVRVSHQPIVGTTPRLRVVVGGELETDPILSLVDQQGAEIAVLTLARQSRGSRSAREYLGEITLPAGAFRVRARGTDALGRAYDLVSDPFTPATFEARLPFGRAPALAGRILAIPVTLKNHGAAGQFEFETRVSDELTLLGAARESIMLAEGETREVTVTVLPPPVEHVGGDVNVSLRRQADASVTNGSTMRVRVVLDLE